ncbi:MAG TPA: GatB/YqeY domain-containing protein [Leptospiraceae bacterium]|nr:GatB/YqeY domain-containing protein [Leptospiraceae bacterium]HMW05852.1 GatB/YqeY domain-containing protein [Leptospiraceae bacterium]HMX33190.1 GatB/YqeY domain-containing protein [Leptospiraceae bacterium]HMY33639.1 GatB/YqeY domain-containing protein [Leptospiraceae bacterium]HMZ64112.1 GatB/YqeY domain-containing protein [Leptospiraceae bacterium]
MSLQVRINEDLKSALKSKEEPKLSTLRLLKSDIQYELTKTGASTLSDDQVIAVIRANSKKRRETAAEYRKANREDLALKEESEDAVLVSYLPASMPEAEIREVIAKVIQELSPKPSEVGKVIGKVMQEVKGKNADGSLVSNLVKSMMAEAS